MLFDRFFAWAATAQTTDYSGTYIGTCTYTKNAQSSDPQHPGCTNLSGSFTSSGQFEATLQQSGNNILGTVLARNATDIADDGHEILDSRADDVEC